MNVTRKPQYPQSRTFEDIVPIEGLLEDDLLHSDQPSMYVFTNSSHWASE